jgi:hypothetical protein
MGLGLRDRGRVCHPVRDMIRFNYVRSLGQSVIVQGCKNPGRKAARATEFCTMLIFVGAQY